MFQTLEVFQHYGKLEKIVEVEEKDTVLSVRRHD